MEVAKGFLKLQEENNANSRRSSLFQNTNEFKNGMPYATKINCGCGRCLPWAVKVEREEGGLRIGRLTLAPHCHLILLAFGCCFLLAGGVLTGLAYNRQDQPQHAPVISRAVQNDESEPKEEKVAGPLFVVIGSGLIFLGVALALLGCKLNRAAERQRAALSRFSFDTRSADIFANLEDIRSQGGDSTRRGSFFGSSFNPTRRSTLSTIAQAVPVGFFMSESPRTPKTPISPRPEDPANVFQEIELSSPKRERGCGGGVVDEDFDLPALALRPSIPIPMFISPMLLNAGFSSEIVPSRSDEPFGSIVSLGGTRDVASFPASQNVFRKPPTANNMHFLNNKINTTDLPPIKVDDLGNALTASGKKGARPLLRATKSEEQEDCLVPPEGSRRPGSGS